MTDRDHHGDDAQGRASDVYDILAALPDIILLFDESGHYLDVFTGESDLLAAPEPTLRGKSVYEVLPDEIARTLMGAIATALRDRNKQRIEYHLQIAGSLRWFEGTLVPLRVDGQERVMAVVRDVTERKRAEERITQLNAELRQRAAELEAANAELESFGYSVSHDLRAPLRAIDGFSTVLAADYADALDERGQKYLSRLRQASKRMAKLIDDLLELSRTTRSAMAIEPCDMSAVAGEIVNELRRSQPERNVETVIEPALQVRADPGLLRVILQNLLGNAWKFTAGQPRARVELGSQRREDGFVYFVRDNGAGFDMAYVGKLFEPFQRLHGPHEFEGSGVGLATVRRIIRRHGGQIWAEGKVEEGATFRFTLP